MKQSEKRFFAPNRRRFDFGAFLQGSAALLSATALLCVVFLLVSFQNKNFKGLNSYEVYVLVFLVGLLGVHLLHYLVLSYLPSKRRLVEDPVSHEGYQPVYTQAAFHKVLRHEMRRSGRYHLPMTLCLVRLDDFDAVLRTEGRAFADKLIQNFAELMIEAMRSSDYLTHVEETEFCVLLCHTDLGNAEQFLLRVLLQTQERLEVSFSAGLTSYRTGENMGDYLNRVRQALKQAEQEGLRKIHCVIGKDDSPMIKSF